MTLKEVLTELEALGTEQTRKTYARHGSGGNQYGVKFGDHYKVAKRIGTNHDLAQQLWTTGNFDARVQATLVADPAQATAKMLETWANESTAQPLGPMVVAFVLKTGMGRALSDKWRSSKKDLVGEMGWSLVSSIAMHEAECPDGYFKPLLDEIEKTIHGRSNRTRYGMNGALCGIGIARAALRKRALEVAKRIGKVEVDHGDTACQTPDAAAYIMNAVNRGRGKPTPGGKPSTAKKTAKKSTAKKSAKAPRAAAKRKTAVSKKKVTAKRSAARRG